MKNIIINYNSLFALVFFNYKVYSRSKNFFLKKKNDQTIDESLWTATDGRDCDNFSNKIVCEIYSDSNKTKFNFLEEWGGSDFSQSFMKHSLLKEVRKIVWEFMYAEKVRNKYKIKRKIYFWPNIISLKLYNKIRDHELIPKSADLHTAAKIYLNVIEIFKFLYFSLGLLFFLEQSFLSIKFSRKIKDKFSSGVVLDDGQFREVLNNKNYPIGKIKIMSLIEKDETLIINDNPQKINKVWSHLCSKDGYNVLNLENVSQYISKVKYIKKYYYQDLCFRLNLLRISLHYVFLIKTIYECYKYKVLWQMFYQKFSIKTINKFMIYEHHAASVVHKMNNCKTVLTYFSNTEPEVRKEVSPKPIYFELSYMNFDYLISSQISINFLKNSNSNIGEYISLGPIFSDLSFLSQKKKENICYKLNIPKEKKIITFFDNTYGHYGINTINEQKKFIESIYEINNRNKDYFIIYKPKKIIKDNSILELLNKIKENKNFTEIKKNSGLQSEELIGLSDIIISSPFSSIQIDVLSVNKKLITFDYNHRYYNYITIMSNLTNCNAHTINELDNLIKYWLEIDSEEINNINSALLRKWNIQNNDKNFIKKYKELINNFGEN